MRDGGLRFDPQRDVLYAINSSTNEIIGYDSITQEERFTVPLDWNIGASSNFGSGMMAIAPGRAIISDDAGLLVVDVPQPNGVAARFELSGTSSFAKAGAAQKIRIRALDLAGYQIPSFRGTVTFYSSDPAANLPAPYTFTAADNGVAEVSFTLNTPGTQSLTLGSPGITAATVSNLTVHAPGVSVIPITDSRENVFDAKRNRLYLSTPRGVIERYDLATETMLEPLAVGVNLYGIDISADGRWLMVQEGSSSGTNGQYIKVDLNLLDSKGTQSTYITRITYANASLERGGWDIARTVRGTSPYPTGSVRFGWDATPGAFNAAFETQVSAPYSLFKDDNGNLRPGTFKVGSHTLTATAYTGTNANGTAGAPVTVHFNVIDTSPAAPAAPTTLTAAAAGNSITLKWIDKASNETGFEIQRATNSTFTSGLTSVKVPTPNLATYTDSGLAASTTYYYRVRAYVGSINSGFTNTTNAKTAVAAPVVVKLVLINADTDTAVLDLFDGMTISKATYAALKNFSVQAVTSGATGSVKFGYQGNASARIEGTAPWSLFGDGGTGNYVGNAFNTGGYTVSATPYSAAKAKGTVGTIVTIHFTVVA